MEIKKDFRNELLKRRELIIQLESEKNPGFDETRKKIAEKFAIPEDNIDVLRIKGSFGKEKFLIETNVYDSKEDLEKMKKITSEKKDDMKKEQEIKETKEEQK